MSVYLVAQLHDSFDQGFIAVEFKIDNLPSNDGYPTGQITEYFTGETQGELGTNILISWPEPIGAGHWNVPIGRLEFIMFDSNWIGEDHLIAVRAGDDCNCITTQRADGQTIEAIGCGFTFNCTNDDCWDSYNYCVDSPPVSITESSWSLVKALF